MLFSYKAKKVDGSEYEGTLEAADKFALYKELHSRNETVLSVKEKSSRMSLNFNITMGGTKPAERIMFAKNLAAMLKAGLPLARALTVMERQMSSAAWKPIFASLEDALARGTAFSAALAAFPKTFSPLFVSMVAAGEESGNLSGSLSIVGDQLERSHQLQKKVRGAMMYPAIILLLMLAIGVLMFVYVVPKLTATFKEFRVELPLATRAIIGTSDFLQAHFVAFILGIVVVVAALLAFRRSAIGKRFFGKLVLKLPVIGVIAKEVNSARTARTLSSLLSSGVEVVHAIQITSSVVQNVHYQEMLAKTAEGIQKGSTMQSLFMPRGDIYPPFVAEMIGVGEETGSLSKVLYEVALFYEGEVEQKTKDMSSIIEPFLMVAIGLGVGFFALAIISPIYSLSSNI